MTWSSQTYMYSLCGAARAFTIRIADPLFMLCFLVAAFLSSDVVVASGARVSPRSLFVCDGAMHAARVSHTIPPFRAGGPSCLTISASHCTYNNGLQITIPASIPPPTPTGTKPLVRILIYRSTFLSSETDNAALLIQSTNSATSQHYRLEVVIANSTIRAERATTDGYVFALRFFMIQLVNANITIFGCDISTLTTGIDTAYAIFFSASPSVKSSIQLLSSTALSRGKMTSGAIALVGSSATDTTFNIFLERC